MQTNANFATNLLNRPSIFEICASNMLDKTCFPGLNRILTFLDNKYSLGLDRWIDEISFSCLSALQYFYFQKHGGSLGENFYGLQRVQLPTKLETLSLKNQLLSVCLLTVPQYLRNKMTGDSNMTYSKHLQRIFAFSQLVNSINMLTYLMKVTETHSPLFKLLGLAIKYPETQRQDDQFSYFIFKFLEISAFFLQFIQWWQTNDRKVKFNSLKTPGVLLPTSNDFNNLCPICLQALVIPTVNSISGYVFCWKCMSTHLSIHKYCPVTNLATDVADLIRIYE